MKTRFNDWTIEICETDNTNFGKGFVATAYVEKSNGTKANVRIFWRYDVKSKTEMRRYAEQCLNII